MAGRGKGYPQAEYLSSRDRRSLGCCAARSWSISKPSQSFSVTSKDGGISTDDVEPLARVFESFVLMDQNHAAREDTIVFQEQALGFADLAQFTAPPPPKA